MHRLQEGVGVCNRAVALSTVPGPRPTQATLGSGEGGAATALSGPGLASGALHLATATCDATSHTPLVASRLSWACISEN